MANPIMIEIEEMSDGEIEGLLNRIGYGHLGCSHNDQPYVIPVNYAYDHPVFYIYTTEGKKVEILRVNSRVCLQVEDVKDNRNWESVIVFGKAVQVMNNAERDKALKLVAEVNPTLTPAISIRWMDNWVRENIEVVLRIEPEVITGRMTVDRGDDDVPFIPPTDKSRTTIL